jgi:hypothetical protein
VIIENLFEGTLESGVVIGSAISLLKENRGHACKRVSIHHRLFISKTYGEKFALLHC